MQILETAKHRYAAKAFDGNASITAETIQSIKELLRLSPSSVNAQPWHFLIAKSPEAKKRISTATQGPFAYNEAKVLNANLVVVFCAKTDLDESYLQKITDQEAADGRFRSEEGKAEQHTKRAGYVGLHKNKLNDLPQWTAKQTYLSVGAFLLGVAGLGLDAVPIEGFDAAVLNKEFELESKNLSSLVLVAVGHHDASDFNASLPKSRLPESEIMTEL